MISFDVHEALKSPMLVTRERARELEGQLRVISDGAARVALDFSSVTAVTPSFFDELAGTLTRVASDRGTNFEFLLVGPPAQLDETILKIINSHGLVLEVDRVGRWVVRQYPSAMLLRWRYGRRPAVAVTS